MTIRIDGWYVAQTLPGLERTADYYLGMLGVERYIPAVTAKGRNVFRNYAFIRLNDPGEAGEINRQPGIRRMLPIHEERPRSLPPGFVEDLQMRIERGEFARGAPQEFTERFLPNEKVVATNGVFRERIGKFLRYEKGCGIVLGYLLSREVRYRVPLHQLRHAEKPTAGGSRSAA